MALSYSPGPSSKFRCPRCNKGLANNSTAWKAHAWGNPCRLACPREMLVEIEEEMICFQSMFPCPHCGRRFNSNDNLSQHIADKHGVCEASVRSRSPVGGRETPSWGHDCWERANWDRGSWGPANWTADSSGRGTWTAGRDWLAAAEARAGETAAQDNSGDGIWTAGRDWMGGGEARAGKAAAQANGSKWHYFLCWVKV